MIASLLQILPIKKEYMSLCFDIDDDVTYQKKKKNIDDDVF